MRIELKPGDQYNKSDCIRLKVTKAQSEYIASNESSIEAAEEYSDVARPFVIYSDGIAVGFTMFAFEPDYEDPNDRYWLWRFMIDEKLQGQGYGRKLLLWGMNHIREKNDDPITLHVAAWNQGALRLYESIGFAVRNKERIK